MNKAGKSLRVMLVDREAGRARELSRSIEADGHEVLYPHIDRPLEESVRLGQPDVVIIDMEYPDRDTLEDITVLQQSMPLPVVVFSRDDTQTTIDEAIRAGVAAYVVDGLDPSRVRSIMTVAIARFREHQSLKQELIKAQKTLEERKIVEKAKGILMKQRGMDEEQAYRTLRDLAMNRNQRIAQVADNVIALAELLT